MVVPDIGIVNDSTRGLYDNIFQIRMGRQFSGHVANLEDLGRRGRGQRQPQRAISSPAAIAYLCAMWYQHAG